MKNSFLNLILLTCGFCYGTELPQILTLSNGLKVYLLRDDSLPYIRYNLIMSAGSSLDPQGKEGLASLTAQMLERGTQNLTPLELIKKLDNLGTQLEVYTNRDFSLFSVESLSWHNKALLEIFSEVISLPSFENKEISWQKNQILSQIQKLPESASSFTNKIVQQTLFQNTYAHSPMGFKKTVEQLTSSEVVQFYQTHFVPQNSILGVVGKFPKNLEEDLEKYFSKWKKTEQPTTLRKVKAQKWKREKKFFFFRKKAQPLKQASIRFPQLKITFIDKKEQSQSEIRVAQAFVSRTSPDYLLLQMANIILGASGLDSRLFNKVREQHGLTYVIYSQMLPLMNDGLLSLTTSTRLEVTRQTVDKILEVLEEFYNKGVTEEELKKAQNTYRVQLLQNTQTPSSRLIRQMTLNYYGLPLDVKTINRQLRRIRLEDVNRVIQKYYSFDQIQLIIFSDFDKIKDQFKDTENKQTFSFDSFL